MLIVIALIGLFYAATQFFRDDVRTNQIAAQRLADNIISTISNARFNTTLGKGITVGSTFEGATERVISIS